MPTAPIADPSPTDAHWREQELLLMREVMKWVGRSLASGEVLREMLHLMSELLGLNRGRMVLRDTPDEGVALGPATASIRHAYGLTGMEMSRGVYAEGEGITGRVLQSGLPAIVQDIAHEPLFLFRSVAAAQFPAETVAHLLTVNQYYNKNWANISQHPKLQWLTLASCSHESKAKQFHEWIALKKEKNKKEEFLADLFPTMKRADLATLAIITTDREIKDYCQNLGWDKKEVNAIKF